MMKSGLYACIDFTDAPVPPRDATALGLPATDGLMVRGLDRVMPHCVDVSESGDTVCLIVGRIDDDDGSLAEALGLARNTTAAIVAHTALDRFGDNVAAHMAGEWSCLLWEGKIRRLRLAISRSKRDPVYYQLDGARVAVAPDLASFRRLGWAGGALDEDAFLLTLGRPALRSGLGARSIMRGVFAVREGTVVTIEDGGRIRVGAQPSLTPLCWEGDFSGAIAEVDQLMRASMRRRMAGHHRMMCLISGGLDSSIIAWLASAECQSGQSLSLLSSVSPPGSGIPDESAFSDIVARHLDLPIVRLAPDADLAVYRPSANTMEQAHGPMIGPRHYLYDALHDAALADGSTLLLDGATGEMTVTGYYPLPPLRTRLRRTIKRLWQPDDERVQPCWPDSAFQTRMAPHRLAPLSDEMRALWEAPEATTRRYRASDAWGFFPGSEKMMRLSTEAINGRLRGDYPFRDAALVRRFAGFPISYTNHGGLDRAFARMLLAGHLPDSIRLRPKGSGFSPDYNARLQRQAQAQRARLPLLRKAGIDDWFDLDWLDEALQRVAAGGTRAVIDPMQVQTTALAAEYLYWWFNPNG